MKIQVLSGLDSLLSTVQIPAKIPVGTTAIGRAGAVDAAFFAAAILALKRQEIRQKFKKYCREQTEVV